MEHRATGTLCYDPRLPDRFDPWWVIVRCEEGLGMVLRQQVESAHGITLEPPPWGMHISVVSGEEPPLVERWGHRADELVAFSYLPEPRRAGQFWWVEVDCPELLDVRAALGLPREPARPLHMTLGRLRRVPGS
jgi:hypothetical protein